tara:strand:- start:5436 stop:5579 length:144 start_codon:yes stop_codon:yes gene_type:complete
MFIKSYKVPNPNEKVVFKAKEIVGLMLISTKFLLQKQPGFVLNKVKI